MIMDEDDKEEKLFFIIIKRMMTIIDLLKKVKRFITVNVFACLKCEYLNKI